MDILCCLGLSFNQPRFCGSATWNSDAITFAHGITVGASSGIYVDINNTVYVTETDLNRVQVWHEGSTFATRNITGDLNLPYGLFVSTTGDVYVGNENNNRSVQKWTLNATNAVVEMYVNG